MVEAFQELLGTRTYLVEEFDKYVVQKTTEKAVKYKVMNSLDVNLMLVFLWLGCLT